VEKSLKNGIILANMERENCEEKGGEFV